MKAFWIAIAALAGGLVLLIANDSDGEVFGLDSDRFGSLLYVGVLGAFIGSAVLASGQRFGEMARQFGLWTLAILLLVAGYEYRYELQDVASRVSGGLVPPSPLSSIDADGRAIVTLAKRPDGHFVARVLINGEPVTALVDTGASSTVLTAADAARAGFDPATLRFVVPVSTANGVANAARIVADEVAVGDIVRTRLPLLVVEDGRLGQSLLGMNFIGSLSGFDLRGDRLILRD